MGEDELLPLYHFGYFFSFRSLIKLSLSQPMGFLTLALPAFSPLLLEEGNSDWALGFWLGSTHHTIQGKPTPSESPPTAKNAWAGLISQAWRHTRTKQYKNTFLQRVKKVNKRYPKVWVGYHITLFNCFVTVVS